jgi:Flp pilus assembly protein TadD
MLWGNSTRRLPAIAAPLLPNLHIMALNNLGITLMAQGKGDEAVVSFQEAERLGPDHLAALSNLAAALAARHEQEAAAGLYRKAIQLAPALPEPHNNHGRRMAFSSALFLRLLSRNCEHC